MESLGVPSDDDFPRSKSSHDVRSTIRAIEVQLNVTRATFDEQRPLRNALYGAMSARLNITEDIEFEPFFLRYYDSMNADERETFGKIRALTEGPMQRGTGRS